MRVLLAEGDRMIGEAIQAALKDASCAADWVQDGQAVRRRLRRLPAQALPDRGVARPHARRPAAQRRYANPVLGNGTLSLDPATRPASVSGGAAVQLSNREFALLQALLVRRGAWPSACQPPARSRDPAYDRRAVTATPDRATPCGLDAAWKHRSPSNRADIRSSRRPLNARRRRRARRGSMAARAAQRRGRPGSNACAPRSRRPARRRVAAGSRRRPGAARTG